MLFKENMSVWVAHFSFIGFVTNESIPGGSTKGQHFCKVNNHQLPTEGVTSMNMLQLLF